MVAAKKTQVGRKAAVKKKPQARRKAAVKKPAARRKAAVAKKPVQPRRKVAAEQPIMAALRAEHKHIAMIMEVFSQQLKMVEAGDLVDTHIMYETMDYMVSWSDRYHHPREDLVYGRVAEIDALAADNVDSLQREHDEMGVQGRRLLADIARWREGKVMGGAVVKSGRRYVDRMFAHMNSEEELVFPQIEAVLSIADWRELALDDKLQPATDPIFGTRVDREFRNLARKVRRNVRLSVERGAVVEWIDVEALMESFEVVSMAIDSARNATGDHLRTLVDDSTDILRETPLTGVFRCAVNNTRLTASWVGDVLGISRDTLKDLGKVNQARKDRIRLLDRPVSR